MNSLFELVNKPKISKEIIGFSLSRKHVDVITSIIKRYDFGYTLKDEDIMQDLLIKLIDNYNYLDNSFEKVDSHTIPYLNLITHRLCKDKYRFEKRRIHKNIELPDYFNSILVDNSKKQDTELDLTFFLDELSLKYKVVMELNFQGYSHEEIAKKLGITSDVSRKRLQRARNTLKKIHKINLT